MLLTPTVIVLLKLMATNRAYDEGRTCHQRHLKIERLVRNRGYPLDIYTVTTEDGYILTLYRIKHGKNTNSRYCPKKNPPVLIIHGLLSSWTDFVSEEFGLPYLLADQGFDVWLGNCRGTTFSRKHVDYNEDMKKYWDFSWHEIGYYDLPAFIDFILSTTNHRKLAYIGYSQGTTVFMVLTSTRLEYNHKISISVFLAASAVYESISKTFSQALQSAGVTALHYLLGTREFPFTAKFRWFIHTLSDPNCFVNGIFHYLLFNWTLDIVNKEYMGEVDFHRIYENTPNTASLKQVVHYGQSIKAGSIRMFDYGPQRNREMYGSERPPAYDLSKIQVPVAIFFAKRDTYCHFNDIDILVKSLGNVVHKYVIEREDFGHIDFLFAKDVTPIYNKLQVILKQYT